MSPITLLVITTPNPIEKSSTSGIVYRIRNPSPGQALCASQAIDRLQISSLNSEIVKIENQPDKY